MILYCPKCGHVWKYGGAAETETSCPLCKSYIHLKNNRVNKSLPNGGDYGGAIFLGVSEADPPTILYFDESHKAVIEYLGEPNPFSRSLETPVSKDELQTWLKAYHWNVGIRYRPEPEQLPKEDK